MNLKISIITPSLNQGEFIEENILSVLNQNYQNFEHIIIDGGSSDNTLNILNKYQHLIWESKHDRGQSHALNKGLKKATGEIIGWFNSDDRVPLGAFQKVNEYFNDNPEEIAVVGNQIFIDKHSKFIKLNESREYEYDYLLNKAKGITQNSIYFKRNVISEIGYLNENLIYSMDREYFIRLSKIRSIKHINKVLGEFRLYSNSKTGHGTYRFSFEHLKIRKIHGGKLLSKSHRNDLYIILTQPLRRIESFRKMIQRSRSIFK